MCDASDVWMQMSAEGVRTCCVCRAFGVRFLLCDMYGNTIMEMRLV